MGVISFNEETTSVVPPATLYKALANSDHILPKTIPEIQSIEIVEGNGGPGSIKKLTFLEDGETKYALHKVDVIDEANFVYNYSIVEGLGLPESVEKISFEGKLVAGPDGGSISKMTVTYHTKGDATPTEKELLDGKVKGEALLKAIEGYVLANP